MIPRAKLKLAGKVIVAYKCIEGYLVTDRTAKLLGTGTFITDMVEKSEAYNFQLIEVGFPKPKTRSEVSEYMDHEKNR